MVFAAVAVQMCWAFGLNYTDMEIKHGWMLFLYQFPLLNAIFLPFIAVIVASRICDTEHKGAMIKQLCTITPKGKLFDAKLIFGIAVMIISVIIFWLTTIVFGRYKGFEGEVPIRLYVFYLIFTLIPAIEIYILQHTLALCFKNQAIGFFTGITGEFIGILSMFLPQIPILRKIIPWGHFGQLQFVGMFGWTKTTKWQNVYFEILSIDISSIIATLIFIIALYFIGRYIFIKREV